MNAEIVTLQALSLFLTFVQASQRYNAAALKVGALLQRVQQEGRSISEEEWRALLADDDVARARLQAKIDEAQS